MTYNGRSGTGDVSTRRTGAGDVTDVIDDLLGDRDLVVASNREPYRHERDGEDGVSVDRPTGGLTAGLDPVMQRTGGTWVAWGDGDRDFDVVDGDGSVAVPPDDPEYRLARLRLSESEVRDYYYGFSNQVLWPICHSALTRARCEESFWRRYREVNDRFAAAVAERAGDRSLVWFQDYHLALAPDLARSRLSDGTVVMQFWHIPWPAWDTFRACPHRERLVEGLLGNDVLGFHTPRYRTNFLECANAALDGTTVDWEEGAVHYRGRTTTVGAIPMGVPVEQIARTTGGSFWSTFVRQHDVPREAQVAVGVDRLDYTKGIRERLRALEHLWEREPTWRGQLTYVQKGSKSRSRIPAYREVQEDVADAVERINDRFGTDVWQPVVEITEQLPREDIIDLYRHADMALVTPIRDGMNLVAQEYVAAQRDRDGVLVLSDQAGTHDEIGGSAVSVTPTDIGGFADAIGGALSMPAAERRNRMHHLYRCVAERDLGSWLERNLVAALEAGPGTPESTTRSIPTT